MNGVGGAPQQLPLGLRLRADATFANFIAGTANAGAVHALRAWLEQAEGGIFYLSGTAGCGRSHLLQAACHSAGAEAIYLPLAELAGADAAALLEGMEQAALLCLDDIDAVSADPRWCEQLFHLCNRLQQGSRKLLVSAAAPAAQIVCALPDLRSRLSWGPGFRLQPLDDEGRRQLLQVRARERGFTLHDDVVAYILSHCARSAPALLQLLERLDAESLQRKKRISVALVRACLEAAG